jgi:hypothetical protein
MIQRGYSEKTREWFREDLRMVQRLFREDLRMVQRALDNGSFDGAK